MTDEKTQVWVYRTSPGSLSEDFRRMLLTSDFRTLNPNQRTLIKVNANYDKDWPGCNTSPWFLRSLLRCLRQLRFKDITVIEGDLKRQPALSTIDAIGLRRILDEFGVNFVPLENGARIEELPALLENAQLISTPVMHTHTFAVISVAAKNLYGLLPLYREKYHCVLSEKLIELSRRVKVFTIVDGTVGVQGGSMRLGSPLRTDLLLAGWDPISMDVISAQIMGFSIDEIPYLSLAKDRGLIPSVKVMGDFTSRDLPTYDFSFESSFLSMIDIRLRSSTMTRSLFEYGSFPDSLGNALRRRYTEILYNIRKHRVYKGSWTEYRMACEER